MDLSLCLTEKSFKIELFEQVGGNKDKRRPGFVLGQAMDGPLIAQKTISLRVGISVKRYTSAWDGSGSFSYCEWLLLGEMPYFCTHHRLRPGGV
jgi:hypothetical protein